jgi:hypothetical protein
MSPPRLLSFATALGAAVGLMWWALYDPRALPLGLLLGVHALAGLVLGGLALALRAPGALGVTAAVVLGLIIAPASFAPAQQAGLIGGKTGFIAIVLGCGALTLAGLGIGALVNVGRRGVAFALAALYVPLGLGLHQLGVARAPVSRFPTAMTAPSFPRPRTLVYGIDGADFRVIDPMIARGELPNLKALIDRGAHGELIAPEPLASPVVWTTIFTGQLPKTHGLTDWLVSDARSRLVPTLWEIFSANDARSVVVNVPGSWPPHEVPGAKVLAGFPLPGLGGADKGHLTGLFLTSGDDTSGAVTTRALEPQGDAWTGIVKVAAPELGGAVPTLTHAVLDALAREHLIPVAGVELVLTFRREGDALHISGAFDESPVIVQAGDWSPWLTTRADDADAVFRVHATEVTETVRVFVSPTFASPTKPRHPFAVGLSDNSALVLNGDPYIVEGLGWTAHRDPRVSPRVPEMVLDVQQTQLDATRALVQGQLDASLPPHLTAVVFTATDRLQHSFWHLHEPSAYPGFTAAPGTEGQDVIERAYREADAGLGALLAQLGPETLVFVVSDHGADIADGKVEHGEAGHRAQGVWFAAGPGVSPNTSRQTMNAEDVVPTLLRCVGAPGAQDFDGKAREFVCPGVSAPEPIATYLKEAGSGRRDVGQEQQDQIQALGYMENDEAQPAPTPEATPSGGCGGW